MGDKTQIATVAMAAHYPNPFMVVIGTTIGMMVADVPAVFIGDRFTKKIPMKLVHSIAAAMFAVMGALALLKVDTWVKRPLCWSVLATPSDLKIVALYMSSPYRCHLIPQLARCWYMPVWLLTP
jgi:undecaprenyl pyrophosphate phosphatase UppP